MNSFYKATGNVTKGLANTRIAEFDFNGGIHPPENKHQSTQQRLQQAPIPDYLMVPVHQHHGKPARLRVEVGDSILKGQLIADADGDLSVPIHAPTSGTVQAIEDHHVPHPSGLTDLCVMIEPDHQDQWTSLTSLFEQQGTTDIRDIEPAVIVEHIRQCGIAGMGGAGFPTAVKLTPKKTANETDVAAQSDSAIHTLIINAAECEPYITADDTIMREFSHEIIRGCQILLHTLSAEQCLIGIEDNKPEAISALNKAIDDAKEADRITIVVVPTKYPSGGEKQLIKLLTDLEVPTKGTPANLGLICQNVATVAAVARAVDHGEPLISRITTVTGDLVPQPGNWQVLLGTPLKHLLELSGYSTQSLDTKSANRVIMGGPMMGYTLPNIDVPITKTSNCLLIPSTAELPLNDAAMACIRCGQCAEVCPSELLPQQLYWFSRAEEYEKAEQHNLADCIECGACSYVCPSQIPLVQYYRNAKGVIKQQQIAHDKALIAKQRYEARLARQQREQEEKEAKRKARAAAAAERNRAKAEQALKESSQSKTDGTRPDQANGAQAKMASHTEQGSKSVNPSAQPATDNPSPDAPSEKDKLDKKIRAQKDRIEKAVERLDMAQQQQLDTVSALEQAVSLQKQKLDKLEQQRAAITD